MAEYANRVSDKEFVMDNVDPTLLIGKVFTGEALNVQLGYLFKSNNEIAGRVTAIRPNEGISGNQNQYTLGFSRYIVGHKLKFQTDLTYIEDMAAGVDDGLVYRMQFELHF